MRSAAIATLSLACLGLVAAPALAGMGAHMDDDRLLLAFHSMYGVDGPFIADTNPVRGVVGDEAPWEVKSVRGSLTASGHLVISVRGLVFKDDPAVPPELRGKNDETQFRALVSCVTEGTTDTPTVNVETAGFPTNARGNAFINAHVTLPNPCVAPIVMILAGSEEKWFAMTGVETGSGD